MSERNEVSVMTFFIVGKGKWQELSQGKEIIFPLNWRKMRPNPIYEDTNEEFDGNNTWILTRSEFLPEKTRPAAELNLKDGKIPRSDESLDAIVKNRGVINRHFANTAINDLFRSCSVAVNDDATYQIYEYDEYEFGMFIENVVACRICFKANIVDGVVTRF